MKVAISYPPIVNNHGQKAMVSQNRNVQFFQKPTYLLPVVQAQAATWLQQLGHQVFWDDGNAQLKNYQQWRDDLVLESPDVVVFESTTPVMKFYWKATTELKKLLPEAILIISCGTKNGLTRLGPFRVSARAFSSITQIPPIPEPIPTPTL